MKHKSINRGHGSNRDGKPAISIRRLSILSLSAVLVLVLCGVGYSAYRDIIEHRFTTVTEGQVYHSAEMPPEVLAEVVREYEIRAVVDLRAGDLDKIREERSVLESMGVQHVHLPTDQVPEEETVQKFLDFMEESANRPVLIHCVHGYGRSVLFSAIYRIEFEGWNNDRARKATRLFPQRSSFSLAKPKGQYLATYVPRRD